MNNSFTRNTLRLIAFLLLCACGLIAVLFGTSLYAQVAKTQDPTQTSAPVAILVTIQPTPISTPTPTFTPTPTATEAPTDTPTTTPTATPLDTPTPLPTAVPTTPTIMGRIPGLNRLDVTTSLEELDFSCREMPIGAKETLSWSCKNDNLAGQKAAAIVNIYGRTVDTVDYITALTVSDIETTMLFFDYIATLPYIGARPVEAKQWVKETLPLMTQNKESRTTIFGGVEYKLSLADGGRGLTMGALAEAAISIPTAAPLPTPVPRPPTRSAVSSSGGNDSDNDNENDNTNVKGNINGNENEEDIICGCLVDTLNCSNFSLRSQAQQCFDLCQAQGRGDVHGLDPDNDGLACEAELP